MHCLQLLTKGLAYLPEVSLAGPHVLGVWPHLPFSKEAAAVGLLWPLPAAYIEPISSQTHPSVQESAYQHCIREPYSSKGGISAGAVVESLAV